MKSVKAKILKRGPLTGKESAVLAYLCEGYHRKEIAIKMFRSPSTVGKHVESIASKFEAHCTAEIVAIAVASGMVKITTTEACPAHVLAMILVLVTFQVVTTSPKSRPPTRTNAHAMRIVRVRRELGAT